jgi:protein-export membrane protein SecD
VSTNAAARGCYTMPALYLLAVIFLAGASMLIANDTRAQDGPEAMSKPGAHLVLSLDADEVRTYWLTSMRDEIRSRLREAKVGFGGLALVDNVVQVRLSKPEDADSAVRALADLALTVPTGWFDRFLAVIRGSLQSDIIIAKGEGGIITISPTGPGLERRTSAAVDNTLAIVSRRLDGMGVAASAERQGRNQIYVHAPSLQDTSALKELLTKPARLGFHEVHPSISVEEAKKTRPPSGYRIYPGANREESDQLLRETPAVRGDELKNAQAAFDSRTHEPVIAFTFNGSGARKFGDFTKTHVGRPFAIVLDAKVISAPIIRDAILGGSGQISGNFTVDDAKLLAVQLRAGTLLAKLAVVMERVVPFGL